MKKIIKVIVIKISRIIFWIIPNEFKFRYNSLLENKLNDNLVDETFKNFKDNFKKSLLFKDTYKIREYSIKTSLLNDKDKEFFYLEFGVWTGKSANYFSKYVKKLYAFDSFQGLKEDWIGHDTPKGYFNLDKQIPKLNSNVEPIVGWVEDTLDNFLEKHNPKINFVHFDMDTYSPTKFALERLKPYLIKDAIIIFDELYNYIGWEEGEYKALKEVFKESEFEYKAFKISSGKCVIQIK